MRRRVNQVIAGLLAACLALAGVVGLSPDLHRLLEHGGQGAAHVHAQGDGGHSHASPNGGTHTHRHDGEIHFHAPASSHENLLGRGHREFRLPTEELAQLWRFFIHVISGPARGNDNSQPQGGGHHHDSLTQLLAGGLVDLSPEFPPLAGDTAHVVSYLLPDATPLLSRQWYAPTAERGPPVLVVQPASFV